MNQIKKKSKNQNINPNKNQDVNLTKNQNKTVIFLLIIIIFILILINGYFIYNQLANKHDNILREITAVEKSNNSSIDIEELKTLLSGKIKNEILKETGKENQNLRKQMSEELDKKLAILKKELKAELLAELSSKFNQEKPLNKVIVLTKLDEETSKDIISQFWQFIKSTAEKNNEQTLTFFYNPYFNFYSGSDVKKDALLNSLVKFNENNLLTKDNYEQFFTIKSVYFFKSGLGRL